MLTEQDKLRYDRNIIIPEIGEAGQLKLQGAKVLVIGAGGLGCPLLLYLAAAGVGTIGIADGDQVALSNLQRQILYGEADLGKMKAPLAAARLTAINSRLRVNTYPQFLDEASAPGILADYDMVAGATDNFASRYLIDRHARALRMPYVHGSIHEFEGQAGVFNYLGGPSYAELFPEPPPNETLSLGVMGVLPGIIGSIMGAEVIKIITGAGQVLSGKLIVYSVLWNRFHCLEY